MQAGCWHVTMTPTKNLRLEGSGNKAETSDERYQLQIYVLCHHLFQAATASVSFPTHEVLLCATSKAPQNYYHSGNQIVSFRTVHEVHLQRTSDIPMHLRVNTCTPVKTMRPYQRLSNRFAFPVYTKTR